MNKFVARLLACLTGLMFAGSTFASGLASTDFGTIQADVISTIGTVTAIGVAILVVSLGWDVGFSLVKKFIKKGAK